MWFIWWKRRKFTTHNWYAWTKLSLMEWGQLIETCWDLKHLTGQILQKNAVFYLSEHVE